MLNKLSNCSDYLRIIYKTVFKGTAKCETSYQDVEVVYRMGWAHQPGLQRKRENAKRLSSLAVCNYQQSLNLGWQTKCYLSHGPASFQPHSGKNPECTRTVPQCLNPEKGKKRLLGSWRKILNFMKSLKPTPLKLVLISQVLTNYINSAGEKSLFININYNTTWPLISFYWIYIFLNGYNAYFDSLQIHVHFYLSNLLNHF